MNPPRRQRRSRPDYYQRESRLRLGAILVSVALLAFTVYLLCSHRVQP